MPKTILVPLDGSPLAERAVSYATAIVRRTGGRIVLVQAVKPEPSTGLESTDAQLEAMGRAEDHLCAVADRLGVDGIVAESQVCCDEPVQAILDAAERHGADTIVMSTHGRSEVGRMLFGSVADLVLRRASIPVLVVPSIVEQGWGDGHGLSLLVPLDGSALAEEALVSAKQLADAFDARLTLLRVLDPPSHPIYGADQAYAPFDEAAAVASAEQYLEVQAARLRTRGLSVETRVALGEPSRTIAGTAREQQAGLIVMATHGHGRLRRLMLGSVAASVLRQTTVPLLVVRPLAVRELVSDRCACTMSSPQAEHEIPATTGTERAPAGGMVLTAAELELIKSGLRALAYAPGYDYGHVRAARALASRLEGTPEPAQDRLMLAVG